MGIGGNPCQTTSQRTSVKPQGQGSHGGKHYFSHRIGFSRKISPF